jgi:hypothetical protein
MQSGVGAAEALEDAIWRATVAVAATAAATRARTIFTRHSRIVKS